MRLYPLLSIAALGAAGCAHSIDVFAPAAEVSPTNDVVAAIAAGHVEPFQPGARLQTNGDLTRDGRVVAHVAKDDTLVVRASAGTEIGRVRVERAASGELLTLLGVVVTVGGTVVSLIAAGQCPPVQGPASSFGTANAPCLAAGGVGVGASFALGIPLIALGIGGPLIVIDSGVRVSVGPTGFRVTF